MKSHAHWQQHLLVGLCFALLIFIMTLPAPFQLRTHLIGNNVDDWIFYWNNWWFKTALAEGHTLFFTPYAFAPQGASLTAHSNSFVNSLLALPFDALIGPVAAYNLVWLLGLWIGALGMYVLIYDFTRNTASALIAGAIFTFAPYHITQALAHGHLGSIHWWPWYAYFLRRAIRGGHLRDVIGAGLCAALTLWTGLQLAVMLAMWTGLYLAVELFPVPIRALKCSTKDMLPTVSRRGRGVSIVKRFPIFPSAVGFKIEEMLLWMSRRSRNKNRESGTALCILETLKYYAELVSIPLLKIGLIALCLSLPLLLPILNEWESDWTTGFDESLNKQTDLVAYVTPPTYHPLWGDVAQPTYENFIANRAYMPYLGYVAVGLTALGVWGHFIRPRHLTPSAANDLAQRARRQDVAFWSSSLLLWILLSAGSALRVNGTLYKNIPLPYRWIANRFPFSTLRSPDRLNLLVVFSLAALAGYGVVWLSRHQRWLILPVSLLLMLDYMCLPLLRWELLPTSPFFTQMAEEPPDYAVLDYPMGYNEAKLWLYYQTLHGKPTVEGHISRYTPELYTLITANPLTRALYQDNVDNRPWLLPAEPFTSQAIPVPDLEPALQELTAASVRYLLIHKPYADADALTHLYRIVPFAPIYEDETLSVYDLTAPHAVTYNAPLDHQDIPPITFENTISLTGYRWQTTGANLTLDLFWDVRQMPTEDYKLFVHLLNTNGDLVAQYDAMPCAWACPTSTWHAGDRRQDSATLQLWNLPAGAYHLALGWYHPSTGQRLNATDTAGNPIAQSYVILEQMFEIQHP